MLEGSKQYSFILDMDGCMKKRSRIDKVSMFFYSILDGWLNWWLKYSFGLLTI